MHKLMKALPLAGILSITFQSSFAQQAFEKEGHRGCRGLMPENTIAAMKKAVDLGVTLEMDISFTKEKMPVVSHDQFVSSKLALKANGDTVAKADEKDLALYNMTYAEIRQYDVGKRVNPAFPTQKKIAAHIPLLAALIDSVENYARQQGLSLPRYNIETKTSPKGDNVLHPEPQEFVKLLMEVIHSKNIQGRVIIQSFDPRTLEIMHRDYPVMPTAFLVSNKNDLKTNLASLTFQPTVYSPEYKMITADLVTDCHSAGIKIIPWTVNTQVQIDRVKKLGVDGIISDYPDRL